MPQINLSMEIQGEYTDDTILTQGEHRLTILRNVPPEYLLELYKTRKTKDKELLKYIDKNLEKIKARQEDKLKGLRRDHGYKLIGKSMHLTCASTDKLIYLTEKDAKLEIKRIKKKKQKRKKPVRAYQCVKCGGWHLTSLALEEWEKPHANETEEWASSDAAKSMQEHYEKGIHELTQKIASLEEEINQLKIQNVSLLQSNTQLKKNLKAAGGKRT